MSRPRDLDPTPAADGTLEDLSALSLKGAALNDPSGELSLPEGLDLAVFRSSSDTSGDQNINGQLSGYYWGGDQELSYSFP
ncbi:MAG: hypothetical protein AAGC83_14715, partial [Pseudomonadota bacterium]